MKQYLRPHRRLIVSLSAGLVAMGIFVLIWFQPQKLFIEETVNEALPGAESGDVGSATRGPTEASEAARVLVSGAFASLEHETSGSAQIVELPGGHRVLRFENLQTSNGPDLRVYLSEIPASDDWRAYGERFIDLGSLKGNRGNQNYEIPDGVDLDRYKSAVIWCRRFTVGFGVAGLL